MTPSRYTILPVPDLLSRDVACIMLAEFTSEQGLAIKALPGGVPAIVFHQSEGQPTIESIITQSGVALAPPTLFLCGPGIEPSVMKFKGGSYSTIQVVLKPQALKTLFGLNAAILAHTSVELNELATDDLNGQLIEAKSEQQRLGLITSFLADKLRRAETRDEVVEEALRQIHTSVGSTTVRTLLASLNMSERQLERLFRQTVGLSPQSYIRVRRFNEAIRLMKTRQYETLTEVAYALNFHDQSHFIRDIKAFSGVTPKGLSQKADFFHDQVGYLYL